ncbi:arginine/ornithine N-succinyltransferase beta subunit [Pseudomonas sp. GM78]|nr:arginine/ornithine N-succinyltransferase beta subunit [Pseudomonas sp. GM78]
MIVHPATSDDMPAKTSFANLLVAGGGTKGLRKGSSKHEPALGMLKAEGFEHRDYIDIFDSGPLIECATGNIRAVRDSQIQQLSIGTPGELAATHLIHNRQLVDCRITAAAARVAGR